MVLLTNIGYASIKKVIRKHLRGRFIDSLRIYVRGGSGGSGLPKYGGVGGQGGNIIAVAKEGITLKNVTKQFVTKRVIGGNGLSSQQKRIQGERGSDVIVEVPVGVSVIDSTGTTLGELNTEGSRVLLARGGSGGSPKSNFNGMKGQCRSVTLDLKLIADVGLVGFPNAGKSSLLKAISRAKPAIASYPFTTIRPNIGVIEYQDHRQVSVADTPGLIEGAHANVGMGHRFLKHVERTKLIVLVVDVDGFRLSVKHSPRTCLETILLLNKELELYKEELIDKPVMLVVNKMDTQQSNDHFHMIKAEVEAFKNDLLEPELRCKHMLRFQEIVPVSALKCDGIDHLKQVIRRILDENNDDNVQDDSKLMAMLKEELRERGPNLT